LHGHGERFERAQRLNDLTILNGLQRGNALECLYPDAALLLSPSFNKK
jgi:hypothetical protein